MIQKHAATFTNKKNIMLKRNISMFIYQILDKSQMCVCVRVCVCCVRVCLCDGDDDDWCFTATFVHMVG